MMFVAVENAMELSGNLWIVLGIMATILGIGGGAISVTTLKPWGQRGPFPTPMTDLSLPIGGEARQRFNQGILAYRERAYGRAIDHFNRVLELEPSLAEAFHNRGRALANLAKQQNAVADFLAASRLYDQQDNRSGIDWIKADMTLLAQLQADT